MKRLLYGVLAALALATPASAVNSYRPTDSSGLTSPDSRDSSAGLGSENNPDLSSALTGRRPITSFNGPGFLPSCQGTFSVTNIALQSNTFTTTWTAQATGSGTSAPTVTTGQQAPDGSPTATKLVFSAVAGAASYSNFAQTFTASQINPNLPYDGSIWMKNVSTNKVYATFSGTTPGLYFNTQTVLPDGKWHHVEVPIFGSQVNSATVFWTFGVDTRDPAESATTTPSTVYIWRAQVTGYPNSADLLNYIPTTTAAVTQTQTVSCPKNIAWRNFARLTPANGSCSSAGCGHVADGSKWNPITTFNTAEAYQAGGVGQPLATPWSKVNGVYYAWVINTPAGSESYPNMSLYYSKQLPFWAECQTTNLCGVQNPLITASSGLTYVLHGVFAPSGCSVDTYCVYYNQATNTSCAGCAIYMAHSSAITGPYTVFGSPTPVIANSQPEFLVSAPQLPSIIQVGSLYYMYVSEGATVGGILTNFFTSPATDGVTWTFGGRGLQPAIAPDWDTGEGGLLDSWVIHNDCGFYEYFYSAETPGDTGQQIGYAVAADPRGPWFKAPTPVVGFDKAAYYGNTRYVGTPSPITADGQFYFQFSYAGATAPSGTGLVSSMPDACSNFRAN